MGHAAADTQDVRGVKSAAAWQIRKTASKRPLPRVYERLNAAARQISKTLSGGIQVR